MSYQFRVPDRDDVDIGPLSIRSGNGEFPDQEIVVHAIAPTADPGKEGETRESAPSGACAVIPAILGADPADAQLIKEEDSVSQTESLRRPGNREGRKHVWKRDNATSKLCKIAILTALATVLLLLEFPIFPATPFYQLNFSDVPVLIGTFMFGPWVGCAISTLKVLLFFFIKGSSSAFIGEIANIVGGIAYVVPAGLIYVRKRNLKGALWGILAGSVSFIIVMALTNVFLLLPWYAKNFSFFSEYVALRPRVMLVLTFNAPFNAIKCAATTALTFLLYKSTRKLFRLF